LFGKEGKVSRPSKLKMTLLEYYIRIWHEKLGITSLLWNKQLQCSEQMNTNFGIKSILSKNWGAYVYTKIWREERENSKLPRLHYQVIG
jgi:hypothetical protein